MKSIRIASLALSAVLFAAAGARADDGGPWSGFYVGADAGLTFTSTHFALPGDTGDALLQTHSDRTTFSGGGLLGFNEQFGDIVVGVEGDFENGTGTSSVTACTVPDGCWTPAHDSFTTLNHLRNDFDARGRVRVGWTDGNMLFYGGAGYSYADTKLSLVGYCYNAGNPSVPLMFNFARSKNLSGFNLAAGVERALDEHFVVRAEYLYDDFGSQTYPGSAPEWNDRRISISYGTLRVAVSYTF